MKLSLRFKRASGFTLIELLIAVAVIAMLAAIAYPSYVDYVKRGHRTEARSAIYVLMQQQERFYSQNNTYAAFPNTSSQLPNFKNFSGDGGFDVAKWRMSADGCPDGGLGSCVRVTAVLADAAFDPKVTGIWYDSRGRFGCTGTPTPDASTCWPK